MDLKTIQEEILCQYPAGYKLLNYKHDHTHSLKEFISIYFYILRNQYCIVTNNKNVNYIVAYPGSEITLGECFLMCRHYYPDCTLEEVRNHMVYMNLGSRITNGHRYYNTASNETLNRMRPDEYGLIV